MFDDKTNDGHAGDNHRRTTALALCFSAAEYASPVWSRSPHASKIDPVLNAACRAISGCLRPTRVDDLYLLCGIAPPHIRRAVSSQLEKLKQENDPMHHLYEQDPARKRLKSRHSFLHSVEPLDGSARTRRLTLWSSHVQTTPHKLSFIPKESLPPGSSETWPAWSRDRDWTMQIPYAEMGLNEDGPTTCECGDEQTMKHLLVCPILPQPCTSVLHGPGLGPRAGRPANSFFPNDISIAPPTMTYSPPSCQLTFRYSYGARCCNGDRRGSKNPRRFG